MAQPNPDIYPWLTAPFDPRFPNYPNGTQHCWRMFFDYHRCIQLFDEGHEPCQYFKQCYKSLCPFEWVKRWEEQMANKTFSRDLPNDYKKE